LKTTTWKLWEAQFQLSRILTEPKYETLKINTETWFEVWEGFPQYITIDLSQSKPPGKIIFSYISDSNDLKVFLSKKHEEPSLQNCKLVLHTPHEIQLKRALSWDRLQFLDQFFTPVLYLGFYSESKCEFYCWIQTQVYMKKE